MAKVSAGFHRHRSFPNPFHLTPHSGRRRVLELEPVRRPAGTILRSEPLGHYTLQLHQTGVAKRNFALLLHHPKGLSGARDEFHLAAIVQNLKTLALRTLGSPSTRRCAIACLKSLRIGSVQFASNSTDIKIASIAAVHLSRKTATTSKKLDFSTASVESRSSN